MQFNCPPGQSPQQINTTRPFRRVYLTRGNAFTQALVGQELCGQGAGILGQGAGLLGQAAGYIGQGARLLGQGANKNWTGGMGFRKGGQNEAR